MINGYTLSKEDFIPFVPEKSTFIIPLMNPKTRRIVYWVITLLALLPAAGSSIAYFMQPPEVVESVARLKIPYELLYLLGPLKLLGVLAILVGKIKVLKEWAYAGFVFDFIGAAWLHSVAGDAPSEMGFPLFLTVLTLVSYVLWKQMERDQATA